MSPEADREFQQRYFDGPMGATIAPADSRHLRRQLDVTWGFAGAAAGARVLEVGCGMGRFTLMLAERGLRVEGMERSELLLDRLRAFNAGRLEIPLHHADLLNPPAPLEASFDVVLGFFVLHHLQDLEASFAAIGRLLKPGGRAVFLDANAFNPLFYLELLVTPGMTWCGDKGLARMRPSVVLPAMRRAGLVNRAMTRFGFFPRAVADRTAGAGLERVLERVPIWRALLPFQLFRAERPAA